LALAEKVAMDNMELQAEAAEAAEQAEADPVEAELEAHKQ
jgi:hypothetical protein